MIVGVSWKIFMVLAVALMVTVRFRDDWRLSGPIAILIVIIYACDYYVQNRHVADKE